MHPILFHIGSFELASYGLMMALAYAICSWYLYRRLHYIKLDKEPLYTFEDDKLVISLINEVEQ